MDKLYAEVVTHFNGIPRLAEVLKITPQALYQNKGKFTREQALEIERMTDKKFNADELCPRKRNGKAV